MKKGSHQIQLAFYGVLKEGVCINQETPANWLKVYPESELAFKGTQTKDVTLDSFPSPFIQTGDQKEQTDIVIPNSPEAAELEAAMKVYRTLKNKDRQADLKIVQERTSSKSRIQPLLWEQKETDGRVKTIEQAAKMKTASDQLTLAVRTLTGKKKNSPFYLSLLSSQRQLLKNQCPNSTRTDWSAHW